MLSKYLTREHKLLPTQAGGLRHISNLPAS